MGRTASQSRTRPRGRTQRDRLRRVSCAMPLHLRTGSVPWLGRNDEHARIGYVVTVCKPKLMSLSGPGVYGTHSKVGSSWVKPSSVLLPGGLYNPAEERFVLKVARAVCCSSVRCPRWPARTSTTTWVVAVDPDLLDSAEWTDCASADMSEGR